MSKSHTGNFKNSLKCRLINPAKNEIGDRINKIIGEKVNVNQWRNTDAVITRFENIEKKQTSSYMNLFFFFFWKKQTNPFNVWYQFYKMPDTHWRDI